MTILETVQAVETERDAKAIALEHEKHWIHRFSESGSPLTNVAKVPREPAKDKSSKTPNIRPTYEPATTPFERAVNASGLSIKQLSYESNVSRSTIEKIGKGEAISPPFASRLSRTLSRHLDKPVTYQELGIRTLENRRVKGSSIAEREPYQNEFTQEELQHLLDAPIELPKGDYNQLAQEAIQELHDQGLLPDTPPMDIDSKLLEPERGLPSKDIDIDFGR